MKRALCVFTFAAALSTSAFAAPITPAAPACVADNATAVTFVAETSGNPNCPRIDVLCPAVYDPVICSSNGQVYGNSCLAYVDCAHGCKPYNDAV
jgi:hypothetical protein